MNNIDIMFKKKADYYDETLRIFDKYREAIYWTESELLKWFSDFAIFTLLGSYDLFIIICDYHKSIKKFQQTYYARQASLVCFELLDDISQHFNKNFNELMLNKIKDSSINEEYKRLSKAFNKMRNDDGAKFKTIRDYTIAHRDHNISKQIEIMNDMDNEWIIKFSLEYLKVIEELVVIMYIWSDTQKLNKDMFLEKYWGQMIL